MERYRNKRILHRTSGGQFRKAHPSDIGIMGVCPNCQHFLLRHYDGDLREAFPDPRKFVWRCFTCQPETEAELALKAEIDASHPKQPSIIQMIERMTERKEPK